MNAGSYKSILVISDQHFPYNHPDIIEFLSAIKDKYRPDKIVNIGDEFDYHALSFHPSDPDLMSSSDELKAAINRISPLYNLFPEMDILESNHGSLVYRKAKVNGVPRHVFKSYREVLGAPDGWKWHDELIVKASNGEDIYFCHGKSADVLKHSQRIGMSVVSGHFHEKFEIRYWSSVKNKLHFAMIIGCLIENNSLAFAYNKLNLNKPIIGCAIIINGIPVLLPMLLDENNRWIERRDVKKSSKTK